MDTWTPEAEAALLSSGFERDGLVLLRSVFTPSEVSHLRTTFTTAVETPSCFSSMKHDDHIPSSDVLARYPRFVHPHRHPNAPGRLAREYMLDDRLFGTIRELIGPAWGAQSMFYFKPPGARGQALHQDDTSLRTEPGPCVAAWIALDDADGSNGSLVVVPASHKQELLCPSQADISKSFTDKEIKLPTGVQPVQTELRAGDVLFFHGHLIHGSEPNTTEDRFRRALIFHYIPQASHRVAWFYMPLLAPDGKEVGIGESELGGPCGETWSPDT